ncbi:putative threonyl alanyl trna synthetase sad [Diplodia seriata]|uniref:Putative threonyl alanyl trna synthetase sad n=1 Tax=Diplodia seriata TaxID=420778 RepID=A0A0G2ETX0_9PEZI|nr:putative threonyl alanyl trna synthetase sad [Diplodia seriata]
MYMTSEQYDLLHDARKRVPRYLFRAFTTSPRSSGGSSSSGGDPEALSTFPSTAASRHSYTQEMLSAHLTWEHTAPSASETFHSWTSSLLCALRHAMRKTYVRPTQPACSVYIAVLDTTSNYALPVWPATALYDAYGLAPRASRTRAWRALERHYCFGEYLMLVCSSPDLRILQADCRVASLQRLLSDVDGGGGLGELLPEVFADADERRREDLARAIRDNRRVLCCARGTKALTRREVVLARRLGECFAAAGERDGGAFAFPVAVAFLSLRRWDGLFGTADRLVETELLDEILDELGGLDIPNGLGGEEDFCGVDESLRRYGEGCDDGDDVAAAISGLSIDSATQASGGFVNPFLATLG